MELATMAESINFGMGTVMTHKAFGKHAEESLRAVRDEAVRFEKLLSCFIPESEISRINSSAGVECEMVSNETIEVLSRAIEFSRYSQSLFDVTIGPLITLWNNAKVTCDPPDALTIRRVIPLVDYTSMILNPSKKTAGLQKIGQSIDLGGIGKGFAADNFLEVFKKHGITSAFTNIGGNVAALGTKPDGSPWRVGIQHPREENKLIGLVSVTDKSVVTSGDYQRYFFDRNGKRHHHILDPSNGYPAKSGLVSVTIVTESSMYADALSTILFVAGMKKGIEILKYFPFTEAILIDMDLHVYVTRGLKDCFQAEKGITTLILS
jgi:FAD:protein FMN transferase